MNDTLITQLRQLDKETLIQQHLALQHEIAALRSQLSSSNVVHESPHPQSPINKEIFKVFTDNLSSLVFTCDVTGRFIYTNQACTRLTGYSRQDLLGMTIFDLIHEDYQEDIRERAKARFRGEGPLQVNDVKLIKKDGNTCWVETFGVRIDSPDDSESPFLLCSAIDITARVESALAVRKSEEMFRLFADNIHVAVYVFTNGGKVVYINPFTSRLTGYSEEEMMSMPIFDLIHPDHRQMVMERVQKRFSGESPPDHYDTKLLVKDGSSRWVELHVKRLELRGQKIILGTAIDIKARKKSEDDLRRSEEKFKAFAENLQAIIYTYDSQGKFTYVNKVCEEVSGYSRDELLSMNFIQLIHDDYKESTLRSGRERREGEKQGRQSHETKIIRKDGSHRWLELAGIRLEGEDNEAIILGSAVDITDRIESEQALKESEEKFRSLFERSSDPMLFLDEQGFFDCNQAALKILKADSIQQVKEHPSRLSPCRQPDGRLSSEKATDMIAHAYATGFHRFEWLHRNLEGDEFWVDVSLTTIPFENRKIIFTVWRDISAVKELEQLLREEREQLMVTLRSIGDAVITTNLESRIILMNRMAEQLTGWKQAEARGRKIEEVLDIIETRTGKRAKNPLDQAMNQGTVLALGEDTILRSRDGRQFKIADSASPIRDEKSNIIGGVLVFRDITNRERMQEEVLKLRKLESVGRLAGGIAHDFNNLLTGIMGNIEITMQQLAPQAKSARDNLEKALKASSRATDLTQKLLTFAKGGEPIKKTTAISEIIKDSAEFSLLGSKIALSYDIPDHLWAAEVDAGQISQVIQNLVINAVQAMPEGGMITLRAENVDLRSLQTASLPLKPGLYVKISVRDQGHGIARELRDKIFDPFFTTREDGSGLGLSVIHSIVAKHDGYIAVQSQPGDFAEFTVFLPALGKTPQNENAFAPAKKTMPAAGRILVMDDEEFVREILTEFLTNFGYEVTAVEDGRKAVEAYRQQKFSLVIMDLTIPGGLGGLETIKQLKELDPGVKAVVSSGYANDPVVAEHEQYGFCGYLNKPYSIRDLSELLEKVLPEAVNPNPE